MTFSMNRIHEYFVCHLDRRRWQGFSALDQTAAATMAEQDIGAALGVNELNPDDLLLLCAVCEQALFLANSHARTGRRRESSAGGLKSETVECLGSRSYYPAPDQSDASDRSRRLAPRTEYFLARYPGYHSSRLTRG